MTTNPVLSYVHGIAPMIEINKAATVSRTIMNAETCRAVLFSFDRGEALSEHTAAMPAVVMVLEGRLRIDADGQGVELAPGDLLHFGTRLPHAVEALEPSKMLLLMLDPREKGGKQEEK